MNAESVMTLEKIEPKIKRKHGGKRPGSGRKAGTPNKVTADVKEMAQQFGPDAIYEAAKLAGLIDGGAYKAESEPARIAAINIILDRAYGKATQVIGGEDGQALLQPVINITFGPDSERKALNGLNGQARLAPPLEAGGGTKDPSH